MFAKVKVGGELWGRETVHGFEPQYVPVPLSILTQMIPSAVGTFEVTVTWQPEMQPEVAYTFPIRIGIRNEASNVKRMTGALAFTVSLASMLAEKPES
ncbi:hypothetical protein AUI46_07640 [archaeon 13_1_40CM_2_52_13]|nr:MAG: hypothetical protein AUI46_07640 [archaeon 13_1_40CM_2_52_13]